MQALLGCESRQQALEADGGVDESRRIALPSAVSPARYALIASVKSAWRKRGPAGSGRDRLLEFRVIAMSLLA